MDIPRIAVADSAAMRAALPTADRDRGQDAQKGKFLDRIRGVVFLATPHGGSLMATIPSQLQWFVSDSMRDLKANDAALLDLSNSYRNCIADNCARIRHRVFYEKLGMFKVAKAVVPMSADPGIAGVRPVAVKRDHAAICKPSDRDDPVYEGTLAFLEEALAPPPPTRDEKLDEVLRSVSQTIRSRVQAFSTSIEFTEMMARPTESDPDLQVQAHNIARRLGQNYPILDEWISQTAVIIVIVLSCIFITVTVFVQIFFRWDVPAYVMIGAYLVFVGGLAFFLVGVLHKAIVSSFKGKIEYNKTAVGAIEKTYVSNATKEDPSRGHFDVVFLTAENERMTFRLQKYVSHKVSVGDVGVVVFWKDPRASAAAVPGGRGGCPRLDRGGPPAGSR